MRLFAKDVESSLMLEELGLEVLNACRGRQILASQPRAHVGSSGMLDESAARAQTSPHTFRREGIQQMSVNIRLSRITKITLEKQTNLTNIKDGQTRQC